MRVIPDIDANAERSEKQKEESSKFGKLSYMLNLIYEYVKLGFPRAYQPLNTAIKYNLPFVDKVDNQIVFDYSKLIFSKGDLEKISLSNLYLRYQSGSKHRYLQVEYNNTGVGKRTYNQKCVIIVLLKESNTILTTTGANRNYSSSEVNRRVRSDYVDNFKKQTAYCYIFFYEGKESTDTLFAGSMYLNW